MQPEELGYLTERFDRRISTVGQRPVKCLTRDLCHQLERKKLTVLRVGTILRLILFPCDSDSPFDHLSQFLFNLSGSSFSVALPLQPPRWLHALPSARLRLHSPLRPQLHSTARGPDVPPRPSAGKVDEHL